MTVEEVVGSGKDSHIWFVGRDTYNQNKDFLLPPCFWRGNMLFQGKKSTRDITPESICRTFQQRFLKVAHKRHICCLSVNDYFAYY